MSPSRTPPGDAVSRCRDAVDAIHMATGHKLQREKAQLLQLLSLPHLQVGGGHRKSDIDKLYSYVCAERNERRLPANFPQLMSAVLIIIITSTMEVEN